MTLRKLIHTGLCGLMLVQVASCRKSETLDVDMSRYVVDAPEKTEIDNWIMTNLTDPYNIELVWRFERNLMDVAKDVAPVKAEKIKPTAEAILNIFLKTYEKVGGKAFIKTYTPKQFVLFGSPSYNSDGSITLGTADGGRRVVLYELNDLDFTAAGQVSRKMRTIHHEFTHILNQTIAIPPEFQKVTQADYFADWINSSNTEAVAKSLGFVSRYARSVHTEDFAEMTAHLLIEGQLWFDAYAKSAGPDGQAKLKRKEALVVDYFKQFYNINFRELQYEIAKVLVDVYKDNTKTFTYAMQNSQIANPIIVNFNEGTHYVEYGKSAKFDLVWDQVKTGLTAGGFTPLSFNVVFLSPAVMQLQNTFRNNAGTVYTAYYDFNITVTNGEIKFARFNDPAKTETPYANGRAASVLAGYTPLINYLNDNTFIGDWIPTAAGPRNYLKFAGFTVKGEADNYFYGKF